MLQICSTYLSQDVARIISGTVCNNLAVYAPIIKYNFQLWRIIVHREYIHLRYAYEYRYAPIIKFNLQLWRIIYIYGMLMSTEELTNLNFTCIRVYIHLRYECKPLQLTLTRNLFERYILN